MILCGCTAEVDVIVARGGCGNPPQEGIRRRAEKGGEGQRRVEKGGSG